MNDAAIRRSFHRKVLRRHHSNSDVLVVDELGLRHGRSRADIAVIGKDLHGYEIKGESDSLSRLAGQVNYYSAVFDRACIVVAPCHLAGVLEILPSWWGIFVCRLGKRGAIHFTHERSSQENVETNATAVAELLWRGEAIQVLQQLEVEKKLLRKPRRFLYEMLVQELDPTRLRQEVTQHLRRRQEWRDHRQLS